MVIATTDKLNNILHTGYCYAERVTNTLKQKPLYRQICIRKHKPLKAQKPYTYAKYALRAKDVFVHRSRLEPTSCTRTQKPLNAQNTYSYAKSAYSAQAVNVRKIHTTYTKPLKLHKSRPTYAPRLLQPSQTN